MIHSDLERRAEELTSRLSSDFLGALIVITEDGTIVSWNGGAQTLFGFAATEVVGRSVFETIVPPELGEGKRRWLTAAAAAGSATYESVRCRKDGVRIWVDVTVRTDGARSAPSLLVLNERDITRLKYQREAQLLQTRFRGVLEAGPDATVLVDLHGRIALVNSEAERLFRYTREELLGEHVEVLVPMRFHRSHPTHRSKYFARPQTRPMGTGLELSGRRKDGSEFPVEISLSPLNIDDITLAMAAIRDVTSRKRTEEALKAANAELEAFTYSVSHDLRAPIRQIEGFAKLLTEHLGEGIDERAGQHLRRIQDGSKHMGRLVDDLLHLARVGRQDVNPQRVGLNSLVDEVLARLQTEVGGRDIHWKVGPLPTVTCDPGLMKVVFTNLLSNAVKYTRVRKPAVVEVASEQKGGQTVVFVRDNGVGFDMKYADKLFGVFQRLHRAEEFEGTGVGLATVQRIVHKHSGRIWAEAAVDQGATFFFTLGMSMPRLPDEDG